MDKKKIQKALNQFSFQASPSNRTGSDPATIRDINRLVDETKKLVTIIVDAIES